MKGGLLTVRVRLCSLSDFIFFLIYSVFNYFSLKLKELPIVMLSLSQCQCVCLHGS